MQKIAKSVPNYSKYHSPIFAGKMINLPAISGIAGKSHVLEIWCLKSKIQRFTVHHLCNICSYVFIKQPFEYHLDNSSSSTRVNGIIFPFFLTYKAFCIFFWNIGVSVIFSSVLELTRYRIVLQFGYISCRIWTSHTHLRPWTFDLWFLTIL